MKLGAYSGISIHRRIVDNFFWFWLAPIRVIGLQNEMENFGGKIDFFKLWRTNMGRVRFDRKDEVLKIIY